jgi:hypothetical protein
VKLTNRDKVLLVVLPAVVIVGGYGYWINSSSGRQTELTRLQKSVEDANRSAPTQEELLAARYQSKATSDHVQKLEKELAQEKQRWESSGGQVFNPATRNERVTRLNNLLVGNGLTLIADAPGDAAQTGGTTEVRTPPALEAFAKQMAERSPPLKPKTWRVRLYGRYPDMMRALTQLAEGEALCVPIGLTMKEWDISKPAQEWTLLVWI